MPEDQYNIVAKYAYGGYPGNPNGSDYNTAMLASKDGRHLATMPQMERSIFKWNWAHYQEGRRDDISPWIEAFINARKWLEGNQNGTRSEVVFVFLHAIDLACTTIR